MMLTKLTISLAASATLLLWTDSLSEACSPSPIVQAADTIQTQTPVTRNAGGNSQLGDQILMNYDRLRLSDFIETIGPMLGLAPIQVDPEVQGTITIQTTKPMSREALRNLFVAVLKNNDAVLRKSDGAFRVVGLETSGDAAKGEIAPQPPQRKPVRVESRVQESRLIRRVEPVYAELARRVRITGVSLLEVTINERGEVSSVLIIRSGHPLLPLAAVDAVKQWRYAQVYMDGVAIPIITQVSIRFDLREPQRRSLFQVSFLGSGRIRRHSSCPRSRIEGLFRK